MDLFSAIETRTSCRQFLPEAVDRETIDRILAAGVRAPSPLNSQPWQFIVIRAPAIRQAIHAEAQRCIAWAIEQSGWKWLSKYKTDFLLQAPVLVAVVGDPKKTGMDMFQEEGTVGYQLACAAAIQNMLLAAHALNLGSLFFTLFDKNQLRRILDIPKEKTPLALVCIGKPKDPQNPAPRKDSKEKTVYLD
ncbi:nitroreductase family protein [uncultured Desulfosarcina sp.]|uniref:nitroreductase family protein n=1 Tax=uncultured Desulfosarcina sp. TaxID=218289 RepID=UPI0029C7F6F2|nr:nitroreductase family protein [uncultured Desulfosarcina sp.]